MKNLLIVMIISTLSIISVYPTDVNGRFVVMTNNGVNYSVKVQLNTNTGTDDLGGSTIVFNFNNTNLSLPSTPVSGVDYTYHNFSGGNYSAGTVSHPLSNQIWLNIELNVDNSGTVVTAAPIWTDVATINFTILNASGNSGLTWQPLDGNWFIFDGNNNDLWNTGIFTDENTTPLPVELTSFKSKLVNDKVQLNWSTKTEVNNFGFEIERSIDGVNFSKIGFVEGNGNSNSEKNYSYTDAPKTASKYSYRLKQIDTDGMFEYSKAVEVDFVVKPTEYTLFQNYPNPFNPATMIKYQLPKDNFVSLKVFNAIGQEVANLVNEVKPTGVYEVNFNASDLSSGIYYYILRIGAGSSNEYTKTNKMILIK